MSFSPYDVLIVFVSQSTSFSPLGGFIVAATVVVVASGVVVAITAATAVVSAGSTEEDDEPHAATTKTRNAERARFTSPFCLLMTTVPLCRCPECTRCVRNVDLRR